MEIAPLANQLSEMARGLMDTWSIRSPSCRLAKEAKSKATQSGRMTTNSKAAGSPLRTKRLESGRRKLISPLKRKVCSSSFSTQKVEVYAEGGRVDLSSGEIVVPRGFDTDFSSIPTPLHWIVRWSRVDIAGVVHDFLYRETNAPRDDADRVWWELALSGQHSANWYQARICWLMLRGFGGWARPKDRPRDHRMGWLLVAFLLGVVVLATFAVVMLICVSSVILGLLTILPAGLLVAGLDKSQSARQ